MPIKRPETKLDKITKMLIEEYQPETVQDLQDALKDLLGNTMEQMLKSELDEHLDYEYGQTPLSLNTRNGSSKKTVKSSYGNIDLNIPRDRDGFPSEFNWELIFSKSGWLLVVNSMEYPL